MNKRKPYMAPAITLFHIEASSMICSSVTGTEVSGGYPPDPPQNSCSMISDGGSWDVE